MTRVTFESKHVSFKTEIDVKQDFISCLMTGVVSALPAFLEAFMNCLAGGSTPGEYKPGDRFRCAPRP